VREHAQKGEFPVNRISEVKSVIDPTTAETWCFIERIKQTAPPNTEVDAGSGMLHQRNLVSSLQILIIR
jgi:hypothetical protein